MASLADLLAGQEGIILDPRHHLRGRGAPQPVSVVRSDGALGPLIDRAVNSDPTPVAIVGQTGQAIILTAGESGVIWRQGEETEAQRAQIQAITEALEALSGAQPSKSAKRRKAQEPAQIEAEIEPEIETPAEPEPIAEPEAQDQADAPSGEEI